MEEKRNLISVTEFMGKHHMKNKTAKPKCYEPNDDLYPLCRGAKHPQEFAENDCIRCCLYEDMEDEGGCDAD